MTDAQPVKRKVNRPFYKKECEVLRAPEDKERLHKHTRWLLTAIGLGAFIALSIAIMMAKAYYEWTT